MSTALSNSTDRQTSGGILRSIIENTPASYFGMVLGLAGIANAWRAATQAWQLPPVIAEVIYSVAGVVWLSLVLLYASKAIFAPERLAAELAHPIQCCFIGLAGVATMLVAGGIIPHSVLIAYVLFAAGFAFMLWFGVWKTGHLWQGGRDPSTTTAVLYLPTVGGSFVAATVVSAFGYTDWDNSLLGPVYSPGWLLSPSSFTAC
jgi:tellurite resistance protein